MKIIGLVCVLAMLYSHSGVASSLQHIQNLPPEEGYFNVSLLNACPPNNTIAFQSGLSVIRNIYIGQLGFGTAGNVNQKAKDHLKQLPNGCNNTQVQAALKPILDLPTELNNAMLLSYQRVKDHPDVVTKSLIKLPPSITAFANTAIKQFEATAPLTNLATEFSARIINEAKHYQPGGHVPAPTTVMVTRLIKDNYYSRLIQKNTAKPFKNVLDLFDYLKGNWQKKAPTYAEIDWQTANTYDEKLLFESDTCRVGYHGYASTNENFDIPKKIRKKLNKEMYRKEKKRGYLANLDMSVFQNKKYQWFFYTALGPKHNEHILGDIYAPKIMDNGNSIGFKVNTDIGRLYKVSKVTENILKLLTVDKNSQRTTHTYYRCTLDQTL